jgi:hypothetical protein
MICPDPQTRQSGHVRRPRRPFRARPPPEEAVPGPGAGDAIPDTGTREAIPDIPYREGPVIHVAYARIAWLCRDVFVKSFFLTKTSYTYTMNYLH